MKSYTHSSFAMVIYALVGGLLDLPINALTISAVIFGALLPDIDTPKSAIGLTLYPISALLRRRFKHRTITHSLLMLPLLLIPMLLSFNLGASLMIGYVSHLFSDTMTKTGVPLLYPKKSIFVFPGNEKWRIQTRKEGISQQELAFLLAMATLAGLLVPFVHAGPMYFIRSIVASPANAIDQYHDWANEYIVMADAEAVWRDSQERIHIQAIVIGTRGTEDLMVYYEGDVYSLGQQPVSSLFSRRTKLHKVAPASVTTHRLVFQDQLIDYAIDEIEKKASSNELVFVFGRVKTDLYHKDNEINNRMLELNKRTEAYLTALPVNNELVFFASPLEKLKWFKNKGVWAHSGDLTVRVINHLKEDNL